jgi:hypothetical protein
MKPTIGRIVHYYEGDFEALEAERGTCLTHPTREARDEGTHCVNSGWRWPPAAGR